MSASTQSLTQITQLYIALFGRAPDVEGQQFWAQRLEGGTPVDQIVEQMFATAPAREFYPEGLSKQEIVTQFYRNALGREPDAEGLEFWTQQMNAGNIGEVLDTIVYVVTHYDGDHPDGLASVALFTKRAELADAYTAALAGAGVDGINDAVQNITQSILAALTFDNALGTDVNALIADIVDKAVALTEQAIEKPEIVSAIIPAGGKLSDLMGAMPTGSTFADLFDFTEKLASNADSAAAIEALIPAGGNSLADFLEKLPAGTTPAALVESAAQGPGGLENIGGGTSPGTGGGGGGGAPTPPATFTVTVEGGIVTFGGTATGNITFTTSGDVATFSRGSVTATTTVDFSSGFSKITVASGQTLSATAAQLTDKTIDGAGTVAITALQLGHDLHNITATTVTVTVNGDVTVGANKLPPPPASITVAAGATLTAPGTSGLDGLTVTGTGSVVVDGLAQANNLAGLNASLNVTAKVTGNIDASENTNLGTVDSYEVTSGNTLTLTAAQTSGKAITGEGGATITGLTADTNLSNITASGTITGTVTGNVNLTAVDLTKLDTLTIASDTTATVTPQQYAVWKGTYDGTLASTDTTAPTTTITAAGYDAESNTLTLTGTNFDTLLESGETTATDIKGRLDWANLVWKIDGSTDVIFQLSDIDSAKATAAATLAIVLTDTKAGTLEGTSNFGGSNDTLVVTAGFARDISDNVATTDGFLTDNTITIAADETAPTITGVTGPADGTYKAGDNLDFTVTFSEAVTVTGTPQIALTIGGDTKQATYQSGTGTTSLVFSYTVETGLTDADGIEVGTLDLNSGTIKDAAENEAELTFTPPTTTGVLVDGVAPTINAVTIDNAAMKIGDEVTVTLTVSDATGETLTLKSGSTVGGFALGNLQKSSDTEYTATFTVTSGGIDVAAGATIPVSITLVDPAGNESTAFTTAITQNNDAIDANAPTLSSSTPADNATNIVVDSNIVLTFNENVKKGTSGTIKLFKAGEPATEVASYDVSGDISGNVTFSGTAVTINPSDDLAAGASYYVQISAGAIVDEAGNAFAGIDDQTTLDFGTANLAITNSTGDASAINAAFAAYEGNTATVNAADMDTTKLTAILITDNLAKIAPDGITNLTLTGAQFKTLADATGALTRVADGHVTFTTDALTDADQIAAIIQNIGKVAATGIKGDINLTAAQFATTDVVGKLDDGQAIVNASGASSEQLGVLVTGIGKVKASGGITDLELSLNAVEDAATNALLGKATGATVVATGATATEVGYLVTHLDNIAANSITGTLALTSAVTDTNITALFAKYDDTTATADISSMSNAQISALPTAKIASDGITGAVTGLDATALAGLKDNISDATLTGTLSVTAAELNTLSSGGFIAKLAASAEVEISTLASATVAATDLADTFVFAATDTGVTISGFTLNTDKINLAALGTGSTEVTGDLTTTENAVYFFTSSTSGDADSASAVASAVSAGATWTNTSVTAYIVIADDDSSAIYKWVDASDNGVAEGELTLIGTIDAALTTSDLVFA